MLVGLLMMRPTGPLPAWPLTTMTASWKLTSGMSRFATRKTEDKSAAGEAEANAANANARNRMAILATMVT